MLVRPLGPLPALSLLALCFACERGPTTAAPCDEQTGALGEGGASEDGESGDADADADTDTGEAWVAAHYDKSEHRVAMRDGKTLFTVVYRPKPEFAPSEALPVLLFRTPYSVGPYDQDGDEDGDGFVVKSKLGPHPQMMRDAYVFVYQDVRGRFMSEGEYVNMTPHLATKQGPTDIDESTDTYDTVTWIVDELGGHNGRVGMWGISYPGFYAAAGAIDAHPALVAVSPQAPIADWWYDDFHHNGGFFLPHLFNFIYSFGRPRPELTTQWPERFDHGTPDGYAFFSELGPLSNANAEYFHDEIPFWNAVMAHPNYDEFWQARNLLPHLESVGELGPAVMTVGGWFDAEDLYGPLHIYAALERGAAKGQNALVMGPWRHGGWTRTTGDSLGDVSFGQETSPHYQVEVERRFFAHHLQHPSAADYAGCAGLPEAYMFETGANRWRQFEQWPPASEARSLWLDEDGRLSAEAPRARQAADTFISDPAHPVPFTSAIATGMTREYMTDDQRFAARRGDVLVYQTEPLEQPLTIAGPLAAQLWVSTDQRDADWIVKVIDVFPGEAEDHEGLRETMHMGGYQMMVRSEVLRGRFRNDPSTPEPFTPKRATQVRVELNDVLHTFEPGHRVMVQIQSSWFPLLDLNPQSWVDSIYAAEAEDYVAATHKVYREAKHPSALEFGVLTAAAQDQALSCRAAE